MFSLLLFAALLASPQPAPSSDQIIATLRAKDQALLDAIAPGDVKTWDTALGEGAVYVDENGVAIPRADFLKQLTPLTAGASGTLKISKYDATVHGDVATVIHTDDEEENYHGEMLHAQYLTTETWQKSGDDWKLLLVHAYAVMHDPPAVKMTVPELQPYIGRYTAGDLVYVIRRDGDHLVGGRFGRPPATLNVEVRDVFFISGQPRTRKIFQRNSEGKVTGFVDRREGIDLVWIKDREES